MLKVLREFFKQHLRYSVKRKEKKKTRISNVVGHVRIVNHRSSFTTL